MKQGLEKFLKNNRYTRGLKKKKNGTYDLATACIHDLVYQLDTYLIKCVHLEMCKCITSIFKSVRFTSKMTDYDCKEVFFANYFKLFRIFHNSTLKSKNVFKRIWKVKRVQLAKCITDFNDGRMSRRMFADSVQNVFDNGLNYVCVTNENGKNDKNMYSLLLLTRIMYNSMFYDCLLLMRL